MENGEWSETEWMKVAAGVVVEEVVRALLALVLNLAGPRCPFLLGTTEHSL